MKKLAFAVLYALCLTVMITGISLAATEKTETDVEKNVTEVQNEQTVEQDSVAKQDVDKVDEECRKKLHKELRDSVDEIEKERCQ